MSTMGTSAHFEIFDQMCPCVYIHFMEKRRFYNNLGLYISSLYLVLTLILKGVSYQKFTKELAEQKISYKTIKTKPTPLNTILWTANIETEKSYLIGNSSFLEASISN